MALRFSSRTLHSVALTVLLLLLAGCDMVVMNPAGDVARQQRDIILISTALMLLIIVPVMILIVVFAWRYRAGSDATYDPDFDHSTSLELVIWSAPLLIIIALGALTWSSTHLLDPFRPLDRIAKGKPTDPKVPPLVVQVISLDWKWLFIYPEQGVASVNELVLPVDRHVRFDITSTNMMNTFYAPTLAGMIYAMPGMQSQMHAVLNKPGTYSGYSANYSGAGFSDMRFRLVGTDAGGFDRWIGGVKASRAQLGTPNYLKLVAPSEKVPVMHFGAVERGLYRRILERCVEPGQTCMSTMMMRDQARARGRPHDPGVGTGMPARGGSTPPGGAAPKGAIFKENKEKVPVPNITKPAPPEKAPGAHNPGDPANRNLSFAPDTEGSAHV